VFSEGLAKTSVGMVPERGKSWPDCWSHDLHVSTKRRKVQCTYMIVRPVSQPISVGMVYELMKFLSINHGESEKKQAYTCCTIVFVESHTTPIVQDVHKAESVVLLKQLVSKDAAVVF
jgi:hypothetical protein